MKITTESGGNFHKGVQLGDVFLAFQPCNTGLRQTSGICELLLRQIEHLTPLNELVDNFGTGFRH